MCGIAGFIGGQWGDEGSARATLAEMGSAIRHRGPDHSDVWTDADARVGFVHNRLAIIDLSAAGNQPMASHSGRYVTIYNGEIYNHLDIRDELTTSGLAPNWRGHSDTETLLAAIEAWGVKGALERSAGMFAFALWDKGERTLTLARDRLGEKPLYYGRPAGSSGPFLFGSELKAIAVHPQFKGEVDREALTLLLRYTYIPAPFSIYRGIAKLPAGSFLTLRGPSADPEITEYWSAAAVAESGIAHPLELSDEQAIDQLEDHLSRAISRQMIADVPLGAFLSGGVDSSTIVALMQKQSPRRVKTFTIGFREDGFNEAEHARAVATHIGTDHTELYVTAAETRDVIPDLPHMFDEPFADPSEIPTHLLSRLAREQVTVSLSGDGGDEIFGGYTRYFIATGLWDRISSIPKPLRSAAAHALKAVPPSAWTKLGQSAAPLLPSLGRIGSLGDKIHKAAPLLRSDSVVDLYDDMVSPWRDAASAVIGANRRRLDTDGSCAVAGLTGIERMMALDMVGYLPDDILVKVDRAAMAVSLETRVPLLDHELVEFAWKLPFHLKVRNGEGKWILRQLLYRHVPRELIDRPKMGFGVPIAEWLRGPLRGWAEELLDERRLAAEGYFHPAPIRRMWKAHLGGSVNHQYSLWSVLMFQSWLEANEGAVRRERTVEPAMVAGE